MKAKDRREMNKALQSREDPSVEQVAFLEWKEWRDREIQEELRRRRIRHEREFAPAD